MVCVKDRPIRCGIIGCGVIGPTHAKALQACEGTEVRWGCDLVAAKAQALAERFNVPRRTTDAAEVLADPEVDVVSICTDHGSHAGLAAAALAAGKDVLCEKAVTADGAGLRIMLEAARAAPDRLCGIVFQHRFNPLNRAIKALVDEGRLGRILTANVRIHCQRTPAYYASDAWRGTRAGEGGAVLINQAIHFIDQLIWMLGPAERLSGACANLTHGDAIETEDTAGAVLRFPNGAIGMIEATCSSHLTWEHALSINGSLGSFELRNGALSRFVVGDAAETEAMRLWLAQRMESGAVAEQAATKRHYGVGHTPLVADFIEAVRNRRPPLVTIENTRHTMATVFGVYRAHETGGWVAPESF